MVQLSEKAPTSFPVTLTEREIEQLRAVFDAAIIGEGPNVIWIGGHLADSMGIRDGDEWVGKDGRTYRATLVGPDDLP